MDKKTLLVNFFVSFVAALLAVWIVVSLKPPKFPFTPDMMPPPPPGVMTPSQGPATPSPSTPGPSATGPATPGGPANPGPMHGPATAPGPMTGPGPSNP